MQSLAALAVLLLTCGAGVARGQEDPRGLYSLRGTTPYRAILPPGPSDFHVEDAQSHRRLPFNPGSCAGTIQGEEMCGTLNFTAGCGCDDMCFFFRDCCEDFCDACPEVGFSQVDEDGDPISRDCVDSSSPSSMPSLPTEATMMSNQPSAAPSNAMPSAAPSRAGEEPSTQPSAAPSKELCQAGILDQFESVCCASSCGVCGGCECALLPGGPDLCCPFCIIFNNIECVMASDVGCVLSVRPMGPPGPRGDGIGCDPEIYAREQQFFQAWRTFAQLRGPEDPSNAPPCCIEDA